MMLQGNEPCRFVTIFSVDTCQPNESKIALQINF